MIEQQVSIAEDCARVYSHISSKIELLKNANIVITGASGFIGCWLSELLYFANQHHDLNVKAYLVDRDFTRMEKLTHLTKNDRFVRIETDIKNLAELPMDVNYIINAAGTPDNRFHFSNPIDTMTTIGQGLQNIVNLSSLLSNLKNIVQISSSSVYEHNDQQVDISEDYPLKRLTSQSKDAYSAAKVYSEVFCSAVRSEAKLPIVVVRPFTFCGPYQELDSPWALNNFINDAIHNRSIRILGDGKSVRSYLYGSDVAAWLLVIAANGVSGQVINLGSSIGLSLEALASKVSSEFQNMPKVVLNASIFGNMKNSYLVPDTGLATTLFGLHQYTSVDSAIYKTVQYYKGIVD